jgi:GT2 family glycosyltransferase
MAALSGDAAEITVAIVTRDRADLFERFALPSLLALPAGAAEVLVVDQSSDDATRRLTERVPGAVHLRSADGLSRGRNVALAAASGAVVAFVDDDVTFPPGWADGVRRAFARDPRAGVVCGLGLDSGGRPLPGRPPGRYEWPENPFGLAHGFNLALRRQAVADAGPFDERLGAGAEFPAGEDSDMVYRVMRAGWALVCDAELTVVHHTWRTARQERSVHRNYGVGAGAQTAKHLRAGDRTAGRLALRELCGHLVTVARWAVRLRPRLVALQVQWLAGLVSGLVRGLARRL